MNSLERQTYRTHLQAAAFEGMFNGVMFSAADVAAKNLGATAWDIMVITMAHGVVMTISLVLARFMETGDRRTLFTYPALLGRLPLVLLLFVHGKWIFIGFIILQAFATVPIVWGLNSIIRRNYRGEIRGRLFSKAMRWGHLASGIVLVGVGLWLDHDSGAIWIAFPAAAICGVVACLIFARMPRAPGESTSVGGARPDVTFAFRILSRDRRFLVYEVGFFLYGIAFMASITAKPLFAAHVLGLSNTEMLGARAVFSLFMVLCTPIMGRVMDRINPAGLASLCYAVLAVHTLALTFAHGAITYLLAEALFGIAMSGVILAWNMGPVTFASPGRAMRYMGVHVALVGVRATIGHPLGAAVAEWAGPRAMFPVSCVMFLCGAAVMFRLRPHLARRLASRDRATAIGSATHHE